MAVSSGWFDMIESGYQRLGIAQVWKFGIGNLAPLAEDAGDWEEPAMYSLILCCEREIGKNSWTSYREKH